MVVQPAASFEQPDAAPAGVTFCISACISPHRQIAPDAQTDGMASVVCPYCNTENRAVAKFCIECIHTLPEPGAERTFVPTARAALMAIGRATGRRRSRVAALPCTSKGLWVAVLALGFVLGFGATGWYVHSTKAKAAPRIEAVRHEQVVDTQARTPRTP
jgi:hypothetical protein